MNRNTPKQSVLLLQNTLMEARRWRLLSFVNMGLIVLLVFGYTLLLPLKTTQIRYVEFSESGKNTFRVVPSPLTKKQKILLIRQILRDYLIKRISYSGSINVDTPNVKQVAAMSTKNVIEQFREVYNKIDKESTIEKREVKIISDIPIGKNAHQVQYRTIDHYKGKTFENDWVATIEYEFTKHITNEENELLNPLGILVTQFHESRKHLGEDDLNEIFK